MRRGFRTTLVSLILAGFCFAGLAAVTSFRRQSVSYSSPPPLKSASQSFKDQRVKALRGMKVENGDGQFLGRIRDFVVDTRSGSVQAALIASGGFLGLGKHVRAVPLEDLSLATIKRSTLELDVTLARWQRMPTVRPASLNLLASDLIGDSVLNPQGQEIARISDLLVDVGGHQPVLAVLSPTAGPKPAQGKTLTVPLRVLIPATGDQVILNTEHSTLMTKG